MNYTHVNKDNKCSAGKQPADYERLQCESSDIWKQLHISDWNTNADGNFIGYSDANWAGDMDDRFSTSGNVFSLAGGAVSWLSKK